MESNVITRHRLPKFIESCENIIDDRPRLRNKISTFQIWSDKVNRKKYYEHFSTKQSGSITGLKKVRELRMFHSIVIKRKFLHVFGKNKIWTTARPALEIELFTLNICLIKKEQLNSPWKTDEKNSKVLFKLLWLFDHKLWWSSNLLYSITLYNNNFLNSTKNLNKGNYKHKKNTFMAVDLFWNQVRF